MIKGEISRSAEVNKEWQADYKQEKREELFFSESQAKDLQYIQAANWIFTYFCVCKQSAELILEAFSPRKAPQPR